MFSRKLGLATLWQFCCCSCPSEPFLLLPTLESVDLPLLRYPAMNYSMSLQVDLSLIKSENADDVGAGVWIGPTSVIPLASLCRSGQTWAWSLSWHNAAVREAKLAPLDCKHTIGATLCFPELNCASLAARIGVYILNRLAVEQAGRPIFTNVQLLSAISLFKQRHFYRAVHIYTACCTLVGITTSCRSSREDTWGKTA